MPESPELATLSGREAELADLCSRQTARVPPGWLLTPDVVSGLVSGGPPVWAFRYANLAGLAGRPRGVVSGGRLRAALVYHVAAKPREGAATPDAVIDWVAAEPGETGALAALLDGIRVEARAQGCRKIWGPTRNGLGIGWFGIPAVWAHLVNGFVAAGYALEEEWSLLSGSTTPAGSAEPKADTDVSLRLEANETLHEWSLKATVAGHSAGEALVWGIPPVYRALPGAAEWALLEWIGVEEAFRSKGLASRLVREQCRLQRRHGIKNLLTCARKDNVAVRRLFASLGFAEGPSLFCFSRPG